MKGLAGSLKIYVYGCCIFFFTSCSTEPGKQEEDTKDKGRIYISVDESFKPVIDSQIKVYESQHPETKIIALYKPEAQCIGDFAVDSIRMVIITRKFSKDEEDFMVDSLRIAPKAMVLARDAISVIVHPSSPDSLFTIDELKDLLRGKFTKSLIPVFDGTRATSTVRFIIDSILHGDSLTPKTMAAKSSEGVIDYVSKNPMAVGFIGVSWIGNPEDSMQLSFLKKVKMAQLESTDIRGAFILPWQANIYADRYPLIRDVVYILKEKHNGLGHAFAHFLSGEKGQMIFKRAYLLPAQKDFRVRPARWNE